MNAPMPLSAQLDLMMSNLLDLLIMLFGYFIPALSSVKAVVRKDSNAYHQWSTYWLILHLYAAILSPFLHLTLHPIFQVLAILWLSLPQYQGATVVYERIVVPWVDQYESQVDEGIAEAHRGLRRWAWSRFGMIAWVLIGEGGSLAGGLCKLMLGLFGIDEVQPTVQGRASNSAESLSLPPRHSLKEALSQSSSEVGETGHDEFVEDFKSMLEQGLYVFASLEGAPGGDAEKIRQSFDGGFKLSIFSYAKRNGGEFVVSPVDGTQELDSQLSTSVGLPLRNLQPIYAKGGQGLVLECLSRSSTNEFVVEFVVSDESDRDILLNGLNAITESFAPST
ncbi:hypothetical protein ACHAWF_018786 [Thalassiosira exigua]